MNHKILKESNVEGRQFNIIVELIPSNNSESEIIKKVGLVTASDEERQMIDNYLLFGIGGNYSVLKINNQKGNQFDIRVLKN